MKKISMFSDGQLIVSEDENVIRKANKEEVSDFLKTASDKDVSCYLSNLFPKEHKGNELSQVSLDKENGYAYGKYANSSKLLKLKVLAQTAPAKQTEPLDSGDKADPDLDVPRNESKSKPQEFKGRKDVDKPEKIRKEEYKKGKEGKDLHTDVVPRDSSGDGVGGESTTFVSENSDDATSGNPDNYVQEWTESETPAKAGSEENHAVAKASNSLDVKIQHAGQDIKLNLVEGMDHKKVEEDSENKEEPKKEASQNDESNKKASKELTESKNEVVELKKEIASLEKQLSKLERDINNRKVSEKRKEAAIGLVLAYRDRQPYKYASANEFNEKVTEIARKMSVESIDSTLEEFNTLMKTVAEDQRKVAKLNLNKEANLSQPVVIPYNPDTGIDDQQTLSNILMQNTKLGKLVSDYENYDNQK